jgi:hypothetical protein
MHMDLEPNPKLGTNGRAGEPAPNQRSAGQNNPT